MENQERFIFEDLRVYRRALDFSLQLIKVAIVLPREYGRIRDQVIGAASSIPLNLAEGSGRVTEKDKKNFYRMARASAFELVPLLDILYEFQFVDKALREQLRKEVVEISKILATLMR